MGTRKPTQYPCTAGSWGNLTNLEKQADCYQCPKGWYCLEGSDKPSDLCETGHFCPRGKEHTAVEHLNSIITPPCKILYQTDTSLNCFVVV
jgi:hypothetical protein